MQQPKEQSIRKKLESILGIGASKATTTPQKSVEDLGKLEHSTFFTDDVLRELDSSVPTPRRIRAMKEHLELVARRRLEEHAVESIWLSIKDLTGPSQPADVRQFTLTFLRNLIFGQFEDLGVLRAHFLTVIQQHTVKEDAQYRLNILRVLTNDGKNIQHLEETIGPFLLSWMPEVVTLGHAKEFLTVLVNFVHYNAAYLDGEVLVGVVSLTCVLARRSQDPDVLALCLDFLNAVVCYSSLPVQSLQDLVTTLCHTLNVEKFAKKSLEVMLKLLGTYLGRNAINTMCSILQDKCVEQNAFLLRGAVFYISMSMWGIRKVDNLNLTFASVLPSIKQAVLSNHTIVVFEVALSIRRLVRTYSQAFHPLEWDLIYDIMGVVQRHLNLLKVRTGENPALPSSNLGQCLRDLFVAVEELYAGGSGLSIGEPERFFALVEENMDTMPLKSVLNLVSYRTSVIESSEFGFMEKVVKFMEKFYVHEKRSQVRVEALNYLVKITCDQSTCFESKLMESAVLRYLKDVASDPDTDVRCRAAEVLVHLLAQASPQWGTQLLVLINSILQKGLQVASRAIKDKVPDMPVLRDSRAAVFGLTDAFKDKLQSSSPVAAQILSLLVVLLQQHYDEGHYFPTAYDVRKKIFGCILNVRSNEFGQVGYVTTDGSTLFSPFFVCRQSSVSGDHAPVITPMLLDYRSTFSAVMACLEKVD